MRLGAWMITLLEESFACTNCNLSLCGGGGYSLMVAFHSRAAETTTLRVCLSVMEILEMY